MLYVRISDVADVAAIARISIKLKGKAAHGRFEPAGSWNTMVTHRIRVADSKEIDTEVLSLLKISYEAAKV